MLDKIKMINTRIWLHCAAVIAGTLLVSWLQLKPYGVLFLILLVLWVYKTRCAASIKIIPPPELNEKILNIYDKLLQMRKDRPTIFCAIITSTLAILAIIGHLLSGSNFVIFGLILSALVSTKYNFKILKVPNKEKLSWVDLTDNDVDEFLPEVNDSNLFVLQRASDHAIVTSSNAAEEEDKSDEIPSELLIPDSIPEIDENSESSDDELIPKIPSEEEKTLKLRKNKNKEKCEEQEREEIEKSLEFKNRYFKKDSSISTSSSDDESLSKGLNFQDYTVLDGKDTEKKQESVISVAAGAAILPHLVSGLMSSLSKNLSNNDGRLVTTTAAVVNKNEQQQQESLIDTSDESDFEILNTDDLNHP